MLFLSGHPNAIFVCELSRHTPLVWPVIANWFTLEVNKNTLLDIEYEL